jgi:hypothetical protein
MAVWYILWQFGLFIRVLEFWTKKNLATLLSRILDYRHAGRTFKNIGKSYNNLWRCHA